MMTPRHGPEAIEKAIIGYTRRQIANAPEGATGAYVGPDSVCYGYIKHGDATIPSNYIFFDAPPAPAYNYDEPIDATRRTADDGDLIQLLMNPRQAHVLYRMSHHTGGRPKGPRGVFNELHAALRAVGADVPRNESLYFSADIYVNSDIE